MALNDFLVRWEITDPLSSWQNLRYNFELQEPNLTRWHIELKPLDRIFTIQNFLCRLQYDNTHELEEVTAERLGIAVFLNRIQVSENRILDYPFSIVTGFLFNCPVEIDDYDDSNVNTLEILIRIHIKRGIDAARAVRNNEQVALLLGNDDIDMLSLTNALEYSHVQAIFTTLKMLSIDDNYRLVHHYILQVRWTNLFKFHNIDENSDSVRITISYKVLKIILKYMYTSQVSTNAVIWSESLYATEFFQVIFLYEIFHMYGALCQNYKRMSLRTMNYSDKRRISIVLNYARDIHLKQHSISFPIYVYPYVEEHHSFYAHTFLFTVYLRHEKLIGPWLSYSVLSQTNIPFNVHVSLEIPGNGGFTKYIHSRDYDIPENERIVSGPILFLGCHETFCSDFPCLQGNEIRKKLLFGLTFRYRTAGISIWYLSIPEEVTRNPIQVFSQHMMDILRKKFKTDLTVQINSRNNGCTDHFHPIHKAIFATRVPRWWAAVEPHLNADANLPDSVQIPLSNESFTLVSFYMYTGKMFHVPVALRDEILTFAWRGGFLRLGMLVDSMD
ncbi:hypothetical protein HNY73_010796 [Argiope bruennichi]|uniref:BTB domain-containing protein n=1 Tax=Argiope bruennichi TaxID=94029 RepID=A0A8T0F255_ARGBR|nr:hypothetical protein HNY73_010796 [Argiope bruennichi]